MPVEENIIELIAEAEREAAACKAQAQRLATETIAAAEKNAAEIAKASQEEIKRFREETLKAAEARALSEYEATLNKSRTEALKYADEKLDHINEAAAEVVGRLTK